MELHGIAVGEVKSVDVEYDATARARWRFPWSWSLYPQRLRGRARRATSGSATGQSKHQRALIDSLVAHGLRAELKTGNLLTGQKFVDLDMHRDVPKEKVVWNEQPAIFPTISERS